jgi:hypothetical protein
MDKNERQEGEMGDILHGCFLGPAGGRDNLLWVRRSTQIAGLAGLCDDVCQMVVRYCEEERLAILSMRPGGMATLTTSPLHSLEVGTASVSELGSDWPLCPQLYYHSRRLAMIHRGICPTNRGEPEVRTRLLSLPEKDELFATHLDCRLMGEIGEEVGRMCGREVSYFAHGRFTRGWLTDVRHGMALYCSFEEYRPFMLQNLADGETLTAIRLRSAVHYGCAFILDPNTVILADPDCRGTLVDRRGAATKLDSSLILYSDAQRCGDDIIISSTFITSPTEEISQRRLDMRAQAWAPHWRVTLPSYICTDTLSYRSYWG